MAALPYLWGKFKFMSSCVYEFKVGTRLIGNAFYS